MTEPKVWLITGASSGFGAELARAVLAHGDIAVVGARRAERLEAIVAAAPDHTLAVSLDVTDAASRTAAVNAAVTRFGRIDVLANIAGRGINGAGEELSEAQLRSAFELNFFGAVELTRAVLPHMRANRSGHILSMTSICGLVAIPDLGAYCASKFALEAWTEALAGEVRDLGIKVTLVEPGGFRTEFEGGAILRPEVRIADYAPVIGPIEERLMGAAGKQRGNPAVAAEIILDAVADPSPPLRLVLGPDAHAMWDDASARTSADIARWKNRGMTTDFADTGD